LLIDLSSDYRHSKHKSDRSQHLAVAKLTSKGFKLIIVKQIAYLLVENIVPVKTRHYPKSLVDL